MAMPDTALWQALREAERATLDHVRWMRSQGITLEEAACAIGLDPANCRGWDDVTIAYAGEQRDMFDLWSHQDDARREG